MLPVVDPRGVGRLLGLKDFGQDDGAVVEGARHAAAVAVQAGRRKWTAK